MVSVRRALLASTMMVSVAFSGGAFAQTVDSSGETGSKRSDFEEIVVTGRRDVPFKADTGQVSRLGLKLIDTPASISVITNEAIVEQRVESLGDVLRNVAGVRTAEFFGGYQTVFSRGFQLDNLLSFTRDGLKFPHYLPPPRRSVDRYEVVKGAGALDYGVISASGVVNYVSKRPNEEEFTGSVDASIGEGEYRAVGIDLSAPLSNVFSFRVTGGYTTDYERSNLIEPEQADITATLRARLTESTVLDFDFEYIDASTYSDPGFPIPANGRVRDLDRLDRNNFYGETTDKFVRDTKIGSARLVHDFGGGWIGRASIQRADAHRDSRLIVFAGILPNDTVRRLAFNFVQDFRTDMAQVDLRGEFNTGGLEHNLLVGADYQKTGFVTPLFTRTFFSPISLTAPVQTNERWPTTPGTIPTNQTKDLGLVFQDNIKLSKMFAALVGLRYDSYSVRGGRKNDGVLSPTGSFVVSFTPSVKAYATYAKSFEPNGSATIFPGTLAPASRGELYESGLKIEAADGRLRFTAAVYQLTKNNVAVDDPANPGFSVVTGEQRSRGIELEAAGRLFPELDVLASFATGTAKVRRDTDATIVGNRLPLYPETTGSLWATWRPKAVAGLSASFGLFYTGSRYESISNAAKVPANTLIDAALAYDASGLVPGLRLQANVRNLFNEKYYEPGNGNGNVFPGLQRRFSVTAALNF